MHVYRRRIPHIDSPGCPVFLTWRLHGTLPANRVFPVETLNSGQAFVAWDRLLDQAQCGPAYLRRPEAAAIVAAHIVSLAGTPSYYQLHAWVVMPNHVHLLVTPSVRLPEVTRGLKGATARRVNQALGLSGALWQDETFDRLVRNTGEFNRIVGYIEQNPVSAGLVSAPGQYPWSSASGAPG